MTSLLEQSPYFLAAIGSCIFITSLFLRFANRIPIHDIPNSRSSHSTIKPRTGGIALYLTWAGAYSLFAYASSTPIHNFFIYNFCALAFFTLGLADDILKLRTSIRFIFQSVFSVAIALEGTRLTAFAVPFLGVLHLPFWVSIAISAFWITGFVNLYNFLDGLDGYAAGEAILVGAAIGYWTGNSGAIILSAAALGFLVYNREPSRIFMGDSGSYFIGSLLAVFAIAGASEPTKIPFVAFLLATATFVSDATVTLIRRIINGEQWYKAHRSHYYQRLTDLGLSHRAVGRINVALTTIFCSAGTAYIAASDILQISILIGSILILVSGFTAIHVFEKRMKIIT